MNIYRIFFALIVWTVTASAGAQTQIVFEACVPYSIPIQSTIVACGPGQIGSKYKTSKKACPSGLVTDSTDYDTSGCLPALPTPGTINNVSKCLITPDACASAPVAQNCTTGYHWTLLGSNVAHCVMDDPLCKTGTSLTHDILGNPVCEQNKCKSNQVLQSDGKTCDCPSGLKWNASLSICFKPITCQESVQENYGWCEADWDIQTWSRITNYCPDGSYGAQETKYEEDIYKACPPLPSANCSAGDTTELAACSSGSGRRWRTKTTTCPSGPRGNPSYAYSKWNEDACGTSAPSAPAPAPTAPACTESSSTSASACGVGFTGTKYTTTTKACPSGTTSAVDVSGCGCANGGNNYPTCTPPYTPPPAPTCTQTSSISTASCGSSFTGFKVITTTQLCPTGTSTSTDSSGCGCANGGADYPTCTPPYTPPKPVTCPKTVYHCEEHRYQGDDPRDIWYEGIQTIYEGSSCTATDYSVGNWGYPASGCPAPYN